MEPGLTPSARRSLAARLMKIWRSAGWPEQDALELELLAAGWVERRSEPGGRESLRLTDAGVAWLAAHRQGQRRALSLHDRLAERLAAELSRAGRLVWRELSLRARSDEAPPGGPPVAAEATLPGLWPTELLRPDDAAAPAPRAAWRLARPDLFSVRHTSVEAYLQPMVHEVKVSRADLLGDLRHAAKHQAYRWLCSECHYVFPAGLAEADELPEALGVWVVHGDPERGPLEQLRAATHRPCSLPFPVWMALARSTPWCDEREPAQAELGAPGQDEGGP